MEIKRLLCSLLISHFTLLVLPVGYGQEGIFEISTGRKIEDPEIAGKYDWYATFFKDGTPLKMELQADFEDLFQQKITEDYQPATLIVYLDDTKYARVNVRVQPRGYSRLKACVFPPLKIDFSHSGTVLDPVKILDEVKMVTLCREGEEQEQYLMAEYLVYRMYQILTDISLGVRRGQIVYVDTDDGKEWYRGPAFFIEDIDRMARRCDAREYQKEKPEMERLDSIQTGIMTVFQFMTGNLDWSVQSYHNIKLIDPGEKGVGPLLPIPYDFDLSRLVDAIYSSIPPDPNIPQPPPAGRIYRGPCFSAAQLEIILGVYLEKENELTGLIDSLETILSPEKSEEIRSALASFYQLVKNPQQVENYFIRYCMD